jgi:hypothetical protein
VDFVLEDGQSSLGRVLCASAPRRQRHFHIFVFTFHPRSILYIFFYLDFVLTSFFPTERLLIPTLAPFFPSRTRHAHALHARLLSWFLDTPAAPFGVHRMALAVRAAGKDVGMWFGPNAAAGALRWVFFLSFIQFLSFYLSSRFS